MNHLTAEFLRINAECIISQRELTSWPNTKGRVEICAEGLKIKIEAFVVAMPSQRIEVDEKWPTDWWQAFRLRWFPNWWLIRHPVRYRKIYINQQLYTHVCPHLQKEPKSTHLEFLASSRPIGGIVNGISCDSRPWTAKEKKQLEQEIKDE